MLGPAEEGRLDMEIPAARAWRSRESLVSLRYLRLTAAWRPYAVRAGPAEMIQSRGAARMAVAQARAGPWRQGAAQSRQVGVGGACRMLRATRPATIRHMPFRTGQPTLEPSFPFSSDAACCRRLAYHGSVSAEYVLQSSHQAPGLRGKPQVLAWPSHARASTRWPLCGRWASICARPNCAWSIG